MKLLNVRTPMRTGRAKDGVNVITLLDASAEVAIIRVQVVAQKLGASLRVANRQTIAKDGGIILEYEGSDYVLGLLRKIL